MMISTKGRYALRVMMDLAQNPPEEYVALGGVAERQGISMKYLEAIVALLNKAGFLESRRGKAGGYRLVLSPAEYTVGEILRTLEGNLAPVSCADSDDVCRCSRAEQCVTVEVWRDIQAAVSSVVDHVTLADLVKRYYEKCPSDQKNDG